ncbi:ThiF family adenylyltransferase [Mesorhizobium sp. M0977]|uniref:ThiF family adenylyltransferase n=1 Tax=Mesorhizobium sp. M0977 TaxID=2957039 RepID=UPI003335F6A3
MGRRVPSVSALRDKTIAIIGLGALGSPIAADLARNGCRKLIALDCDIVEPGNSIRWIAGASAWGLPKAEFLKSHLEAEYPWTRVEAITHRIGGASADPSVVGDDERLATTLREVDCVIDAAASTGVTFLLGDYCRAFGVSLISVYGATTLKGGVVAYHHPTSGCPICKETAHDLRRIPRAPGTGETVGLIQPPGCSEATFMGASFDLQELSAEAVRMAVDILSRPGDFKESVVHTLTLHDGAKRLPPNWRVDQLPALPECGCGA